MSVPETTVNEDDLPASRKNEIGTSGEQTAVKAEPISESMEYPSDGAFRLGIAPPNGTHDVAAFLRRKHVGHTLSPILAITSACLPAWTSS